MSTAEPGPRYRVQLVHISRTMPNGIWQVQVADDEHRRIAQCLVQADAERICRLLNADEPGRPGREEA